MPLWTQLCSKSKLHLHRLEAMTKSGVLIVDKPTGMTSHDVVGRVRRVLQTRRVGHAGTLDPDATGVLVVCVGDACRLVEYLSADDKVYEATIVFGASTDTDDAAGRVLREASAEKLSRTDVETAAQRFIGKLQQRVPRVSAVHIGGRRAYELAREGEDFDAPVREVVVSDIEVLGFVAGVRATAQLRVDCSKGTYIRALCRDLGEALDVPAHLGALRRLRSGRFTVEQAMPLDVWQNTAMPDSALLPLALAADALPQMRLPDAWCERLAMGQTVRIPTRFWPGEGGERGESLPQEQRTTVAAGPMGTRLTAAVFSETTSELAAVAEVAWQVQELTVAPKKVFWKREQ
ncbi:tRNA pseudouridine(55) synthase TruB [Alicyclobacillus sp. ALC3]|nr:tRNA pseudouridine(55) synthase TruB [Alicyclobacillus sp. ALC3]